MDPEFRASDESSEIFWDYHVTRLFLGRGGYWTETELDPSCPYRVHGEAGRLLDDLRILNGFMAIDHR
jgi:hypothetical protein